jgi:hypothetical protein
MVFKVGDKVKYDSGDWLFYGTVTAVIENSISPCYRMTVERMAKLNCKFSITQFEFELSLDNGIENDNSDRKWEKTEMDYLKQIHHVVNRDDLSKVVEKADENPPKRARAGAWERNLALYQKGERSNAIYTWINRNRLLYKLNKIQKDKLDILLSINFPFESKKRKVREAKPEKAEQPKSAVKDKPKRTNAKAWERNLELFKKGEKNNSVYTWISRNRKMFHSNALSEEQLNQLKEANFRFEEPQREKQMDSWDRQFRLWKNGNRNPSLQVWRETSVKRFVAGKLSQDRINKLKEIGILK